MKKSLSKMESLDSHQVQGTSIVLAILLIIVISPVFKPEQYKEVNQKLENNFGTIINNIKMKETFTGLRIL